MGWLVRDGEVLASLEIADTRRARRRGLLGRSTFEGALLLTHTRSVHTVGMQFPIDVAYVGPDGVVIDTVTMARHRIGRPRWRAHSVIEAEAGCFDRWRLRVGDEIEIKD